MRLLLEFSGLLERDWCRARRDDPQGQNADGTGNPGAGGAGAGTAGRRIENMGVLLEQLAPLLDWDSEVHTIKLFILCHFVMPGSLLAIRRC